MALRSSIVVAALAATALAPTGASAAPVAPDVTKLKVTPAAFKPLASGGSVVLSGGAKVTFSVLDGVDVNVSVKTEKAGKRVGGKCVPGKPKKKSGACVITADVPGGFKLVGIAGPNEFRFSGRMADKALAPGSYRLVIKADGSAARSSYARFKIIK